MSYLRNGLSLIVDSLNHNAHLVMPVVIGKAVEISLQDHRIGKISFGVGLTISGLNLMIANNVSSILKSWYWTNIDRKNKEDNTSETIRWSIITLGFVIASYGIFNITTGILELTSNESSADMCALQFLKAKEKFLSCPEGQKLWDQVNSEGSFTIKCVTKDKTPTGACVFIDNREILISETNHDEEMVEGMAFELKNLKRNHAEGLSLIERNRCNLTANEFATEMEAIEYESFKDTIEITNSCVRGGFWSKSLPQFLKEIKLTSFDKYLETQEKYGHTDFYRKYWYEQCNPKSLEDWWQPIWINARRWAHAWLR